MIEGALGDLPEMYRDKMERIALKVLGTRKAPTIDCDDDLVGAMAEAIRREIDIEQKENDVEIARYLRTIPTSRHHSRGR
jgi:hypothetical protein